MSAEDLGYEAAELLSMMSAGEAKSLNKMAEVAVSQVPGCSAAHASIWRGHELVAIAATHPDVAELAELQLARGSGPLIEAVREQQPMRCADTLTETHWSQYAQDALSRGIRCSVYVVRGLPPLTLVVSLFGVRPGILATDSEPMTRMLGTFAQAVLSNALSYSDAQRTAAQLTDSVAARAVVDQAKGILMHALSCDADHALDYLRRESQRKHVKVTELAAELVAKHTRGTRTR